MSKIIIVVFAALLGVVACERKGPLAPSPVTPPPTGEIRSVFMNIPRFTISADRGSSYPASGVGIPAGTVEILVKDLSDNGRSFAIYAFRLPPGDAPDYPEKYTQMARCRSNSSLREQGCAAAIATNLTDEPVKTLSFIRDADEAKSKITYEVVIWNKTSSPLTVEGEYALYVNR